MQDLVQEFIAQKRFAFVWAADNPEKFGNQIFKNLGSRGYEVYPVNPRLKGLDGIKSYTSLDDIPVKEDVVDFVVPLAVTELTLHECKWLGLNRAHGHKNNMKVVHDVCVMLN